MYFRRSLFFRRPYRFGHIGARDVDNRYTKSPHAIIYCILPSSTDADILCDIFMLNMCGLVPVCIYKRN